jgi:hypothetical protein
MAYRFMREHKKRYSVAKTAKVFGVSGSGYYAWQWRKSSRHKEEDREQADLIRRIFEEHHGLYGLNYAVLGGV